MFVHSYISDLVILTQTTVFIKPNQVVSVSKPNQRPACCGRHPTVCDQLFIYLFVYWFIFLSIYFSIFLFIHLSTTFVDLHQSICRHIRALIEGWINKIENNKKYTYFHHPWYIYDLLIVTQPYHCQLWCS